MQEGGGAGQCCCCSAWSPPQAPRQARVFLPIHNKAAWSAENLVLPCSWSPWGTLPTSRSPLVRACLPGAAIILGQGPQSTVFTETT